MIAKKFGNQGDCFNRVTIVWLFLYNKVGELGWKDLLGLAVNNYA